jgi:voltage-gated potassium channel
MTKRQIARDWWETHLEKPTIAIAFLFLTALLAPLAYPFPTHIKATFKDLEVLFWALFSIEYAVRVFVAPDRWRFIKKHPIDFVIVFVPPLQVFHIIRTVGLVAYFVRKARNLFLRKNLWFLLTMAPLTLMVSAVLMYQAEVKAKTANIHAFGDGLWWAIATMSTVGYGDRYPITSEGKAIATLTIIVGVSLVGMITAEIAVLLIGSRAQEASRDNENFGMVMKKLESMEQEIRELKNPETPSNEG